MVSFRTPGPEGGVSIEPVKSQCADLWRAAAAQRANLLASTRFCLADDAPSQRRPQEHRVSIPGGFAAHSLHLSMEGKKLLKGIETLRLQPYDDQTSQVVTAWVSGATIGYGHLIASGDWSTYAAGISAADADDLFAADLSPFEVAVGSAISVGLQPYQFDALVILAFNIGAQGFTSSSVAQLVNDPLAVTGHASLEGAWKAWNKSQGRVMRGLEHRRQAEWNIYTKAVYERW